MHAALVASDGVDFVDDDRLDASERFPGRRAEKQIEGLGGGNKNFTGIAKLFTPCTGGGIAGSHVNAQLGQDAPRLRPYAGKGLSQILFNVVGQRLDRRDVEQARADALGLGRMQEGVEPGEKGRESFSTAGGGEK